MRKPLILLALLSLILLVPSEIHGTATISTTTPTAGLTMSFLSETHQAIGGNCYNAQVIIQLNYNVTDSTGPFTLILQNFVIYATGTNLHLSNSTNYQAPNNQIAFLELFPNVPLTLTLSFEKFCIPVGLSAIQVWLFYFDGANTLKVQIV